jgi:hypothetical protein
MSISVELQDLVEASCTAIAARWPELRFRAYGLREDFCVHWVGGEGAPTVEDVRAVVAEVHKSMGHDGPGFLASVDVFAWAALAAEAVTVVRAWRGGDLIRVPRDHYLYGQVSDGVTYNPDTLNLADVSATERQLAEAVCAHAGITVEEHWAMLGRDAIFEMRQILGDTVLELGESLLIAMEPVRAP